MTTYAPLPLRPRRKLWPWAVALAVTFAFLIGTVVFISINTFTAPVDALNVFLGDLRDGDYEQAYDRLCTSTQSGFSRERFTAEQHKRDDIAGRVTAFDISEVNSANGRTEVGGTVRFARGRVSRVTALMGKEGGDWKVCDFDL